MKEESKLLWISGLNNNLGQKEGGTNVGPLLAPNEGEIEVQFKGTQRGSYRARFRRAVGGKWYLAEVFDGSKLYQPNLEVK
jgi:hypothetical protein